MAKRKYYHSHSFGSFITGFALLAFVALFGAFFVFPVFSVTKGSETLVINGLDYIALGLGKFIQMAVPSFPIKDASLLLNYYTSFEGDNVLLSAIANYHEIFLMVLAAIFVLTLVFVIIEFFLAIFWLLRGRIQFPGASTSLAWTAFAFFAIDIGLLFAFLYFSGQILSSASEPAQLVFSLYPFFILGGVFTLALLVCIVHIVCYRDRKYQKRVKHFDDEEPENKNNNVPQELEEPEPEMPDKGLPEGLTEIGDHAFSKDKSLTIADIPAGIKVLGPAAFANCHNLRVVCIPLSVEEIAYNCFFNTPKLKTINYAGTKDEWSKIIRGSNWLTNAGTTVVTTLDGKITVDPKN